MGSVRQEIANDAIQTVTTYEPYGNMLAQSGSSGTVYAFTGEQFDSAVSLLYLRARYYNPGLKIFMSRDPFPGYAYRPATQHDYAYVSNNPVNKTDHSGLCEEIADEACWSLYEQIVRRYPESNNELYFYNGQWVKLQKLPRSRLREELNKQDQWEVAAEGAFGDCMVGRCPVASETMNFTLPNTGANPGNKWSTPGSRDALSWGIAHASTIQATSGKYGVPPELVAGLLVAEIDLDYPFLNSVPDSIARLGYARSGTVCGDYILDLFTNPARPFTVPVLGKTIYPGDTAGGYSNVHHATYVLVENYHSTQYGAPLPYGTNKRDYLQPLLTNAGSIEFVARMARYLADLRTGNTGSHVADLTLIDMAQMWGAYRAGINDVTCFNGPSGCGFASLDEFQRAQSLGRQAQLGYPFFEFFQNYFGTR